MKPRCQPFWLSGSLCLFCLVTTSPLQAQIVQDATLPNPSLVNANGNTSVITGGTQAGSNLFHSFEEFSVPSGSTAYFNNTIDIQNIISRVTGKSISNIDGLLESNGTANLFLLNPNGIVFGPNASLNIGGSFLASTANNLNFADGNSFSATNSQTTKPLLTVSVPIGLQFGRSAGSIQVQGALQVPSGKTLGLVGGDLTLVGGGLTAEGGRIELGSVAGVVTQDLAPVNVSLAPVDKGWVLGYEGVQNFQDIQLSQQSIVDASGSGGGDIQIQGRRVTFTDGSEIGAYTLGSEPGGTLTVAASESVELKRLSGLFAGTEGTGDAGDLMIATRQLIVRDGAQVFSGSFSQGQGGNLTVAASKSVELTGVSADSQDVSGLFAQTFGAGAAGKLTIKTGQLLVRDGAQVSANTYSNGQGGDLAVTASNFVELVGESADGMFASGLFTQATEEATGVGGNLSIDTKRLIVRNGANVSAATFGEGQGGTLTVTASKSVELTGVSANTQNISGLFTQATEEATGAGGNLSISAGKLIVREGAQVNSSTFGVGRAGDLFVRATDVELVGGAFSANDELLTNDIGLPFTSGLFASTGTGRGGDGGALSVETERLSLRDGAVVQTSTFGAGDAGDLTVQAIDSVELIGKAKGTQYPTSLLALSGGFPGSGLAGVFEAQGRGGDLRIATGKLIVQDGAAVAVSSLNQASDAKGAGNLQVQAQSIGLNNEGDLAAETASGNGGNIILQVEELLLLRRNSKISTTAGIAGTGGDGGNITIDTPFIVAVPSENSDITANAFEGKGGLIQITAQQVFGLERREKLTELSDITAFSQQNPELNGVVEINAPDVDPSSGLVNLPAEVVDASRLIASGCGAPERQEQSEFIVTGRGGLPLNPSDTLSSDTVWSDLRPITQQSENLPISEEATQPTNPAAGQLVEAQGWVINNKGEVVLTVSAPTVIPHSPGLIPVVCHGS